MKKLLVLLFTLALAFSMAMPVFAQDTSTTTPAKTEKKTKKAKATKKAKKSTASTAAPTQ